MAINIAKRSVRSDQNNVVSDVVECEVIVDGESMREELMYEVFA